MKYITIVLLIICAVGCQNPSMTQKKQAEMRALLDKINAGDSLAAQQFSANVTEIGDPVIPFLLDEITKEQSKSAKKFLRDVIIDNFDISAIKNIEAAIEKKGRNPIHKDLLIVLCSIIFKHRGEPSNESVDKKLLFWLISETDNTTSLNGSSDVGTVGTLALVCFQIATGDTLLDKISHSSTMPGTKQELLMWWENNQENVYWSKEESVFKVK